MTQWLKLLVLGALVVAAGQLARLGSLSRQAASMGKADPTFDGPQGGSDRRFSTNVASDIVDGSPLTNASATRRGDRGGSFNADIATDATDGPPAANVSATSAVRRFSNVTAETDNWEPLPWSLPEIDLNNYRTSREFMDQLGELKRRLNISLPWNSTSANVSLPTPIISLNLPKSATLTLWDYFQCGRYNGAHTHIPRTKPNLRIGDCMRENFLSDSPPFQGCNIDNNKRGEVQMYSDVGNPEPDCFYNNIHDGGLEHITRHYPNATIIMMPRPFDEWYRSILKWGNGRLLGRWKKVCGFPVSRTDSGCEKGDKECWQTFYLAHAEKIRRFAVEHLQLTYIEVPLDAEAPSLLESYTGVPQSCLQHCTPGKPKDPNVNLRTYKKCKPIT